MAPFWDVCCSVEQTLICCSFNSPFWKLLSLCTDDGASEGSAAKKVKADSAVGGTEVRWEWENDSHIWVAYSDELNAEVTAALNANKKDVSTAYDSVYQHGRI